MSNYIGDYIDFFIRTELSIKEALQNLIDLYNGIPVNDGDPLLDYYLKDDGSGQYSIKSKSSSTDILGMAHKSKNHIGLVNVDALAGPIILDFLLDLFGWDNVKWISYGLAPFKATPKITLTDLVKK